MVPRECNKHNALSLLWYKNPNQDGKSRSFHVWICIIFSFNYILLRSESKYIKYSKSVAKFWYHLVLFLAQKLACFRGKKKPRRKAYLIFHLHTKWTKRDRPNASRKNVSRSIFVLIYFYFRHIF